MFRRGFVVVSLLSLLAMVSCNKDFVAVSGVVLDANKLYIGIGDVVHLNVDVLPQDATNKKVSWISSDETVASVDDDGVITAVKPGIVEIVVVTEDGGKEAVCEVNVLALNFYKRTVLVYLAADNNLSSFALDDLKEMKQGLLETNADKLHLLVYIDTGSSPRLVELKKQNGQVVEDVVRT